MSANSKNKKWFGILVVVFWYLAWLGLAQAGTNWLEKQKLLASDGAAQDFFGWSVSISGDYAIVGAYFDDDKGSSSGSAYIFWWDGTNWLQQAKLVPADGAVGNYFGCSVSISGDYAIVGAFGDEDNGYASGSAYIFKRDGAAWVQQSKLLASDGTANDFFGYSVSISGGYAIVGADSDDDNGSNSGSAYIFKRTLKYIPPGGFVWVWEEQAKLLASDGDASDFFGRSVSISGDYAIVGADGDDDNGSGSGSAYIFRWDGTNWVQQPKLLASDGAAGDYFGYSVSISGDYAIVGAGGDDDRGRESGSAYIFKRVGVAWVQQPKLLASSGDADDIFGYSVSISGDYAIVGAYNAYYDKGSAYIFKRDGLEWLQQPKLVASDGANNDNFGISVSTDGSHAVVGAYKDDDNGTDSGSAYVFVRCPTADLSGDCFIDFADFAIMADQWLQGD